MGERRRSIREILLIIAFTGLVAVCVIYVSAILDALYGLLGMLKPFFIGAGIAFTVNLPLKFLEEKCFVKMSSKREWIKRPLSILLSFLIILAILYFVVSMVIPEIGGAAARLGQEIPGFLEQALDLARLLTADYPELLTWLNSLEYDSFNWDSLLGAIGNILRNGVGSLLTSTVSVAGSLASGAVNGLISLMFSLYILSRKEKLLSQADRALHAYFREKTENRVRYVIALLYRNFTNFITGQCLEAVILGSLFVVVMSLLGMPYAFVVGILIALTALIPIVGAFIGCFVGAFLILVENPMQALWFILIFLVIQQVEGNLIYPKVVGSSVGLPAIWVLLAVSLGGSLFGVPGMILFIPLFATAYTLLREDIEERIDRKDGFREKGEEG